MSSCPLDCSRGNSLYVNDSGVIKQPRGVYVNNNGIITQPKQIVVAGTSNKTVWTPYKTEFFIIGRQFSSGLGAGGNLVTTGGHFYRENGTIATMPAGWTGKVSFWSAVGFDYCALPRNELITSVPNQFQPPAYAEAVQTNGSHYAWLYIYWGRDGGIMLNSPSASHRELKFTCNGLLESSLDRVPYAPVGNNHSMHINIDPYLGIRGRSSVFTFNHYYDFSTPLPYAVNSLSLRADTANKNYNQLYWQTYDINGGGSHTLRMAVTTTSAIQIT